MRQGFTTDISYKYQELNESTTLSLVGPIVPPITGGDEDLLVTTSINGTCRNGESFSSRALGHTTLLGEDSEVGDTVFTVLCTTTDIPESELIVIGYGKYGWVKSTVCSISPKVTLVDVHYSQSTLSASIPDTISVDPPRDSKELSSAGFAPVMLSNALSLMQVDEEGILNRVTEAFLTGAFELLGTVARSGCLYRDFKRILGEEGASIPDEFRYYMNGTFITETIEWHQNVHALPGVLLAPTLVTSASIILVIITLIQTRRNPDVDGQDYFDLGNFLHVISAASASEFNEPFPSVKADDSEHDLHSEKIRVILGCTKSEFAIGAPSFRTLYAI
ncbi:hypothetical protein AX16_008754 [Volvariella volvacea WC 439]|nr:hypothetical protein AX16_008754 [Volvariella volvacea WC 439]